jgi:aminoglycoside 3-N-acetyltransferase
LFSFLAVGRHAERVLAAQRLDWPLGPIEALEDLAGDVLLLGVTHTSNTTIHLAEQRLGRSCFWRYAKAHEGVWMELPNLPGDSDGFDAIEPALRGVTQEVQVGACRVRRVAVRDVLGVAMRMILADPAALLRPQADPDSQSAAALRQRVARVSQHPEQSGG